MINDPQITQIGLTAAIAFGYAMAIDQLACDGIVAVSGGLTDPLMNIVIDSQTTENAIDEKIRAVIQFFQQRHAKWTWQIGPLSQPASLPHYLQQHGLALLENFPSMYLDLTKNLADIAFTNLVIQEATPHDDLTDWINPLREAFPSSDNGEGYQKLNAKIPHGPGTAFRHYIGYYQNQPVCADTLFLAENSVMIHNLGTKPAFRNQSFGSALTLHAMQEAKKLGFQHCFLDSSTDGFKIYSRLGFQVYAICQSYGFKEK